MTSTVYKVDIFILSFLNIIKLQVYFLNYMQKKHLKEHIGDVSVWITGWDSLASIWLCYLNK